MSDTAIRVEHVSKEYRLGMIGGTTLKADLQRLWAKMRGKEDPTSTIGADSSHIGERFLALDDVSFEVKQGEALGIIGRNGAGKSTLLKLLARVTSPTKGKISYNGRIASMLEVGTGFHGELSGRENIYMNGAILGMTKREITRKLDEIVAFAEMEQFIDTPVKRYSSGMYVKLAFAVAAHLDAEIMIMDEVLAVGDMKFQQKCLGRMGDAANKEGRTVLFVSHNMGAVKHLCPDGLLLDHGKIAMHDKTLKVIEKYMTLGKIGHGVFPVSQLPRRGACSGTLQIINITFCDNDNKITDPVTGEDLLIILECQGKLDKNQEFSIAISVNHVGIPMFHCKAQIKIGNLGNTHKICCKIPRLPLSEGVYYMNMFVSQGSCISDWVTDIPFHVQAGKFFHECPILLEMQMGGDYVYVEHQWYVERR